jgi:hypothetical protein
VMWLWAVVLDTDGRRYKRNLGVNYHFSATVLWVTPLSL